MSNFFFAVIIILSICPGIFAILMTYQLHRKYRENYLSSYLYFQIFMTVFGIYGILGQLITKEWLLQQESSFQTVETIGHFFTFLGLPFLIFTGYMFIRLSLEIVEKKLSRTFNLSYFFALTLVFLAYGIVIVLMNMTNFQDKQFAFLASAVKFLQGGLEILVLLIGLSQLFIHAKKMKERTKRRALNNFAYLNMLVFSLSILFFLHAHQSRMMMSVYLLVFFSRNIPPVLYWKSYLKKHFIAPALQRTDTETMRQFFKTFMISKREEEVIRQLCEGKTNKDISKALFISLQTVKDHIYRIYQKTDVKNRVQLINLIQSYKIKEE